MTIAALLMLSLCGVVALRRPNLLGLALATPLALSASALGFVSESAQGQGFALLALVLGLITQGVVWGMIWRFFRLHHSLRFDHLVTAREARESKGERA